MISSARSTSWEILVLAAAAVLAVLVYAHTLNGPFVFDDEPNITDNRHIRVASLHPQALYSAAFDSPIPSRPLANLSFAVNYFMGGYNPVGYRLVNLLIHIGNGLLVFLLAKATLETPALASIRERAGAGACMAAALWLLHPLHTQSVAYIVQRMTGMATFFYLLSMLCYARGRLNPAAQSKSALFAGCAGFGILALASKEITATLPAFIFLYEWYFFQNLKWDWLRRKLPILAVLCVAFAGIGWFYIGGQNPVERVLAPYSDGGLTAGQRVLTQFRVVFFYISLLLWPNPDRLNLDHNFAVSLSLFEPATTALSLIVLLALTAAAVIGARRHPLGSYAILWFLGNLAIESSVIRLEMVFEHRTYLPSVLPAVSLAIFLTRRIPRKWVAVALAAAVALWWAGWTYQRNFVWADAATLWADCLRKSPAKARPYNNLGSALIQQGRIPESLPFLERAVEIRPDYADAYYNWGYALLRLDRIDEGIDRLQKTIALEPENYMAHNNLGIARMMQGDYPQAAVHFNEVLRLRPELESGHNNLGVTLRHQGRFEEATAHFLEAIRINPAYAEAYNNLGVTLRETGKLPEAAGRFRQALRIQPDYATARRNLDETEALLKAPRS